MKVCITGVTGTIGSLVAKACEEKKIEWIGLSRGDSLDYRIVRTDYTLPELRKILSGCDAVIHLAAVRGRGESYEVFGENAKMTEALLQAMAENQIKKMIFMSSNAVYKDEKQMPWREEQQICPRTFYGLSKAVCEGLIQLYEARGIHGLIFRCAPVISAKNAGFMMTGFIETAIKGETIHVDHSKAKRSFVYEQDAADALLWGLEKEPVQTEVYNLAMKEAYTNLEIGEKVNEACENKGNLVHHVEKPEGTQAAVMDNSKLAAAGFSPKYDMLSAVKAIYECRKSGNV